jgi:Icc-related predicted phosphoesterase
LIRGWWGYLLKVSLGELKMIKIAVFGDVHGKILPMVKLCQRWQKENKTSIDLILSVGDMGVFPDFSKMDKATLKWVNKDPLETGFMDYFIKPNKNVEEIFYGNDNPVRADIVFVRGNHEDHDYLKECTKDMNSINPVDCYQKIFYLPDGVRYDFNGISIAGLGGMHITDAKGVRRRHQMAFIQQENVNKVLGIKADIFLTHDTPCDRITPGLGSADISSIIDLAQPKFHFFGHAHQQVEGLIYENTMSYGLNELKFEGGPRLLKEGCFGILEWQSKDKNWFQFAEDEWLYEVSEYNWKDIA